MPFTLRNTNHVPDTEPSLGARTGFGENFNLSRRRQYSVDSAFGYEAELYEAYRDNLERASNFAGEKLEIGIGLNLTKRKELNRRLAQLQEFDPGLKTLDEIDVEHRVAAQTLIDEQQRAGARSSWMGWAGGLAGTMLAGAAPWRDPLYAASLLFGAGVGRSIATKMVVEAAIGGVTESVQQAAFTSPRYKREGLEGNDPLMTIVAATIGGALIRGAFEVPAPAFRALERTVRPEAVKERVINNAMKNLFGKDVDFKAIRARVTDQELLDLVSGFPQSSERDFAATLLRQRIKEAETSPHPDTRIGRADTEAEVQKATEDLIGDTPQPRVQERAEEAAAVRSSETDTAARKADPDTFKRLDNAAKERDDLKTQLDALREKEITEGDVIQRIDAKKGATVKKLERQLARAADPKRIKRFEKELAKAIKEFTPQKRTAIRRKLGKEKAIEEAELASAYRKARGRAGGLEKTARRLRRKVAGDLKAAETANVTARKPGDISVEETDELLELELREDALDEFLARMQPDENGDLELGLGRRYNQEFLKIETEDGIKTAKEILEDLKEDSDLERAVRECGIA